MQVLQTGPPGPTRVQIAGPATAAPCSPAPRATGLKGDKGRVFAPKIVPGGMEAGQALAPKMVRGGSEAGQALAPKIVPGGGVAARAHTAVPGAMSPAILKNKWHKEAHWAAGTLCRVTRQFMHRSLDDSVPGVLFMHCLTPCMFSSCRQLRQHLAPRCSGRRPLLMGWLPPHLAEIRCDWV